MGTSLRTQVRKAPQATPSLVEAAILSFLICMPSIALSAVSYQLFAVPFVPFAFFEWLSRVLPGRVIGFGISSMVAAIGALHLGETSVVAKLAEETLGVLIFTSCLVAFGMLLFALWNSVKRTPTGKDILAIAFVLDIPLTILTLNAAHATHSAITMFLIVSILCLFWAAGLVYVYRGLLLRGEGTSEKLARHDQINRRQFIVRVGGATAIITLAGVGGALALAQRSKERAVGQAREPWSASHALPNAEAAVHPVPGTRPEFTPVPKHYRIDINTIPPFIKEADWKLSVSGLVDAPTQMTLENLQEQFSPMDQFVTLACISNPVGGSLIGTQRWTGVSLQELLKHWKVKDSATYLKIRAADDFYETVAVDHIKSDPRIMLAYAWDGLPLTAEHGFPLRIYIPDLYGMKQPKWIVAIEAIDHDEPGFWVERGWDKVARMKATSVIDAVDKSDRVQKNGQTLIPIGGIAHAGDRGVSSVEVKVDDGQWQRAQLRAPLSETTWVLWRYDWPFESGHHVFQVRCVDGHGNKQIESVAPPEPSGASGIFSTTQDI